MKCSFCSKKCFVHPSILAVWKLKRVICIIIPNLIKKFKDLLGHFAMM